MDYRPQGVGGSGSAGLAHLYCLHSVTKTNLSVHEDKNRVPFVKVRGGKGTSGAEVFQVWDGSRIDQ